MLSILVNCAYKHLITIYKAEQRSEELLRRSKMFHNIKKNYFSYVKGFFFRWKLVKESESKSILAFDSLI